MYKGKNSSKGTAVYIMDNIACFFIQSSMFELPVVVYIDTEDVPKVSKHTWNINISRTTTNNKYYSIRGDRGSVSLRDVIFQADLCYERIRFKNGNYFDYRKSNIYFE